MDNKDKIPPEIEFEDGQRSVHQRLEVTGNDYDELLSEIEPDNEQGIYDVTRHICYHSLEATASRDPEDKQLLMDFGLIQPVWSYLMSVRGEMLQEYMHDADQRRLRKNNPERYGMDAVLRRGLTRTVAKSNAAPVPDNVAELLSYEDGVLRWKVARGAKAAGSVCDTDRPKIGDVKYVRSRVIYRLVHGVDAGDLNVSDDGLTASPYRDNVKIGILERADGKFDVQAHLPDTETLAECRSQEEAEAVRSGILWTINHL